MKKKTLPGLIRRAATTEQKLNLAVFGEVPTETKKDVYHFLASCQYAFEDGCNLKLDVKVTVDAITGNLASSDEEIMCDSAHDICEFCITAIHNRDANALRFLADIVAKMPPTFGSETDADRLRSDLLFLRNNDKFRPDSTAEELANEISYKGDMTVFRKVLKDLSIPFRKQKGGRPKIQTQKEKTKQSKS